MKKSCFVFYSSLIIIVIALVLSGCGKAEEDPDYKYRVTGFFAGWTINYDENFLMTNVARSDERLKPIRKALKDAKYIYLYEYTPNPEKPAGRNVVFYGANISLDLIYAVKFTRFVPDSTKKDGWAHNAWIPSREARGLKNLSPDTLFIPLDRNNEERDTARDGLGSYNDYPLLLGGPVTYYIVFAVLKDGNRAMGAVIKQ